MRSTIALLAAIGLLGCDPFVMYGPAGLRDEVGDERMITIIDGGTPSGAWNDKTDEPEPPSDDAPPSELPPVAPPSEPAPTETSAALACGSEPESAVFELVNQVRADAGLSPLACDLQASQVARNYSQTMCDESFFSHYGQDGSTPWGRLRSGGVSFKGAGENIAAGQSSAEQVMNSWMNSSGHRANILGDFTHIGIGHVACASGYGHLWTQNFLKR